MHQDSNNGDMTLNMREASHAQGMMVMVMSINSFGDSTIMFTCWHCQRHLGWNGRSPTSSNAGVPVTAIWSDLAMSVAITSQWCAAASKAASACSLLMYLMLATSTFGLLVNCSEIL